MMCEQCRYADSRERPAVVVAYVSGPGMLMVLCDEHENELVRMEGEMGLDEFYFSDDEWLTKLVKLINDKFAFNDKKYVALLKEYSELKKLSPPPVSKEPSAAVEDGRGVG